MAQTSSHIFLPAPAIPKKLQAGLAIFMLFGLVTASATALHDKFTSAATPQAPDVTAEADSDDESR